jgi:hypothetical protein
MTRLLLMNNFFKKKHDDHSKDNKKPEGTRKKISKMNSNMRVNDH